MLKFDQKEQSLTVPAQTKLWGSRPGCCPQRLLWFKHLWRAFFRSRRGHEPDPGVGGSQGPLLSFFSLGAASWGRAVAGNSPDTQAKSEQSTVGVSWKASSAGPLISTDTEGCRTGARQIRPRWVGHPERACVCASAEGCYTHLYANIAE